MKIADGANGLAPLKVSKKLVSCMVQGKAVREGELWGLGGGVLVDGQRAGPGLLPDVAHACTGGVGKLTDAFPCHLLVAAECNEDVACRVSLALDELEQIIQNAAVQIQVGAKVLQQPIVVVHAADEESMKVWKASWPLLKVGIDAQKGRTRGGTRLYALDPCS